MPKFKINPTTKRMEAVIESKPEEDNDQFGPLMKEASNNPEAPEISKTLQELDNEMNKAGFFPNANKPVEQPVQQQMTQQQYNQYQMQQQQMMQQQVLQQQEMMRQQAMMQQQMPKPVVPLLVYIVFGEKNRIDIPLDSSVIDDFRLNLDKAIEEGRLFMVDSKVINCKYIMYYEIGE